MAIPFTGSTSAFFNRVGFIGQVIADHTAYKNVTLQNDINTLLTGFINGTIDENIIDGIGPQLTAEQQNDAFLQFLQIIAQNIANTMVTQDNPQLSYTNVILSINQILQQIQQRGLTVRPCSVTTSTSPGPNNAGNGVVVATPYRSDGLIQQNAYQEHLTVACTTDSVSGAILGAEQFTSTGVQQEPDLLAYDFPQGSGSTINLTAIPPTNDTNGNVLTNSDFENWISNVPNNWAITVGLAGTQIKKGTQSYSGSFSLQFAGDGATLAAIEQTFNSSAGTLGVLNFQSLYAFNCWIKMDVTPSNGQLEVALVDQNDVIVKDQQGNNNVYTVNLNTIGPSWTPFSGAFRTPYVLPTNLKIRIRQSIAIDNNKNLYVDHLALGQMVQQYAVGPSLAVFSGSSAFYVPDYFTVNVQNGRGTSGTLSTWQTLLYRLYQRDDLIFPYAASAGSENVSDSLI